MKTHIPSLVFGLFTTWILHGSAFAADAEPGPEDAGLRLRFTVVPREDAAKPGYEVRLDLLNVSHQDVMLQTAWRSDQTGDVKEYLEAAASIESVPAIAPWIGGVAERE